MALIKNEFAFYRNITKERVTVRFDVGWIWIEELVKSPTWYRPNKFIKKVEVYSSEDATVLAEGILKLLEHK